MLNDKKNQIERGIAEALSVVLMIFLIFSAPDSSFKVQQNILNLSR